VQRVDRIQSRCTYRWIQPEDNSDADGSVP